MKQSEAEELHRQHLDNQLIILRLEGLREEWRRRTYEPNLIDRLKLKLPFAKISTTEERQQLEQRIASLHRQQANIILDLKDYESRNK